MGVALPNGPLKYALVQLVFSPIMAMEQYVAGFQEAVRKNFPLFIPDQTLTLAPPRPEVRAQDTLGMPLPSLESAMRWHFLDAANERGFTLTTNCLSFHGIRYTSFDDHLNWLLEGAEHLHRLAQLGVVERIGLRYVNYCALSDEQKASLHSGLQGFTLGDVQQQVIETKTVLHPAENMTLRVGSILVHGPLLFPQDLFPMPFVLPRVEGNPCMTLDLDGITSCGRVPFDVAGLREQAQQAHEIVEQAFCSALDVNLFR